MRRKVVQAHEFMQLYYLPPSSLSEKITRCHDQNERAYVSGIKAFGYMLELSREVMALTFAVSVGYGLIAAPIRHHSIARPRVLGLVRRMFAGSVVALGAKLAVAQC